MAGGGSRGDGSRPSGRSRAGQAIIEFALALPIFLIVLVGLAELGLYLSRQLVLVGLSREAAGVLSRGSTFDETFDAILNADGDLELSSSEGKIILTEIALSPSGTPMITRQVARGGLSRASGFGTLPTGQTSVPATIPNGMTLPEGMTLMGVELFSRQLPLGNGFSIAGVRPVILSSMSAF
jgi:hypothetical protein